MERHFPRPKLVISRCLGFAPCRYNGDMLSSPVVEALRPYVDVQTPCPEADIGLGIPRDPIRLARVDGEVHLVQPSSGRDVSLPMEQYGQKYLAQIPPIDGFILKSRSPSCGTKDVRLYHDASKSAMVSEKTAGFFGGAVLAHYPDLPVEDEGRLNNFTIRERFLVAIFTLADFRQVKTELSMGALVAFHARNKYLLMTYASDLLRQMGRVVANPERRSVDQVLGTYEGMLRQLLQKPTSPGTIVNVLQHEFGYVSQKISAEERQFFLATLEDYRQKKIPLSACARMLEGLVIRFHEDYLLQQTFFQPFPEELVSISDSGKGRDY